MYNRDLAVYFTLIGIVIGLLIGLVISYVIPSPNNDKDRQYYNPITNQQQIAPKRDKDEESMQKELNNVQ